MTTQSEKSRLEQLRIKRQCAAQVVRNARRDSTVRELIEAYSIAVHERTGRDLDLFTAMDDVSEAQREAWAAQAERLAGCECGGTR